MNPLRSRFEKLNPKDSIKSHLTGKKSIRQLKVLVALRLLVRAIEKPIKRISERGSLSETLEIRHW